MHWKSCVNSTAKRMAVNGVHIVPAIIEAIPSRAHNGKSFGANQGASRVPTAPPIINKGANTPPEVPDPSATAQTKAFTTAILTDRVKKRCRSAERESYRILLPRLGA